jgi:hypothetical protein
MAQAVVERSADAIDQTEPEAGASARANRLPVTRGELVTLLLILALAALLRLVNLPARGGWDADQGDQMLDVWRAVHSGQLPQLGPLSSVRTFHHGALTYDLWLPPVWLGNGDPMLVLAQTAAGGILLVALVWWVARTIGGRSAGLSAACLAAISASLIEYSVSLWNPTLLEPGAGLAILGTWQAWRLRSPRWWLVAAIGLAVVMQAHIAGAMMAIPIVTAFVASLWRGPTGTRRRQLAWGISGAGLVFLTYIPFIAYELGHGFTETRAVVAYFSSPGAASRFVPPLRVLVGGIRVLAWPLTRWPLVERQSAFLVATAVAMSIAFGLAWRALVVRRALAAERSRAAGTVTPQAAPPDGGSAAERPRAERPTPHGRAADGPSLAHQRVGLAMVIAGLCLMVVVPSLALKNVSEIQELPTEQYHAATDPLVLVAAGLVLGGLWQTRRAWRGLPLGRAVAVTLLAALAAWNAYHWPPLTAADGGWPAAQAAARRLEQDAAGTPMALVPLFEEKGDGAYRYPLLYDGVALVEPEAATTVVLLCDSYWLDGCGGSAEQDWLAGNAAGQGLRLIDRFEPAPDRLLSVYRRGP